MKLSELFDQKLPAVSAKLFEAHVKFSDGESFIGNAGRTRVITLIDTLRSALFPGIYETVPVEPGSIDVFISARLRDVGITLRALLETSLSMDTDPDQIVTQFLEALPEIRALLALDIQAAYDGDPAARFQEEILLSYPGFEAVMIYRFAHVLYALGVPVIPRIMTEYAHQRTGIDIHPGAVIGRRFFIDHGTGVVIGETCVIGDNVKMYQGVTLGARSFDLDEHGNPVKGIKRHPDIEDDVIIYSGATILGGDTRIGRGSVIGGNVWLTHSVPPYSKVYNAQPAPIIK